MTERGSRSLAARAAWDGALTAALQARATELAEVVEASGRDAVERALLDALRAAETDGRWLDVSALADALEGRRRARAAVVALDVERRRRPKG